jgi:hypothetical protein
MTSGGGVVKPHTVWEYLAGAQHDSAGVKESGDATPGFAGRWSA